MPQEEEKKSEAEQSVADPKQIEVIVDEKLKQADSEKAVKPRRNLIRSFYRVGQFKRSLG